MKKLFVVLSLIFAFSTVVFADGNMPAGGKNCQNSPCFVSSTNETLEEKAGEISYMQIIFKTVLDIFN